MAINSIDAETIRGMNYMKRMNRSSFKSIINFISIKEYDEGEDIFHQNELVEHFYIVLSGWVALHRLDQSGEQTIIKLIGPSESFGEALIPENSRYPVNGQAVETARLACISTARFRHELRNDPDIAIDIISATFRQLRNLVDRVEQNSAWSCERRVATFLLRCHAASDFRSKFRLPLEQRLIAELLSMTPSTFSRTLAKLKDFGVSSNRGLIQIDDAKAIAKIAANA